MDSRSKQELVAWATAHASSREQLLVLTRLGKNTMFLHCSRVQ